MTISYKVYYTTVAQKEKFPQWMELPVRRMCWCLYQMDGDKPARLVYVEPDEDDTPGEATLNKELKVLVNELNLVAKKLNDVLYFNLPKKEG